MRLVRLIAIFWVISESQATATDDGSNSLSWPDSTEEAMKVAGLQSWKDVHTDDEDDAPAVPTTDDAPAVPTTDDASADVPTTEAASSKDVNLGILIKAL